MKHIAKQPEPAPFAAWKASGNHTYANLQGKLKRTVKQALLAEQGYLCCYCERRIAEDDSHIEHFKPKSDPTVDSLDFGNLLCSCQREPEKTIPRRCGHLKDNWFDPNLLISPCDAGCEDRFAFSAAGEIRPSNAADRAAATTIEKLGLNLPELIALRASAIAPFLDDVLSQEEMRIFVSSYLEKDASGHFGEFWTTIRHLFPL